MSNYEEKIYIFKAIYKAYPKFLSIMHITPLCLFDRVSRLLPYNTSSLIIFMFLLINCIVWKKINVHLNWIELDMIENWELENSSKEKTHVENLQIWWQKS